MTSRGGELVSPGRFGTLTGRRFLLLMLGCFAIVFTVNGLLIYKALTTFDGIEIDDAYQRGRAYNQTLDAMAVQAARGWKATVSIAPATSDTAVQHAVHVVVVMTDRAGAPLSGLRMRATFWHPVSVGIDRSAAMHETAPGHFEADFQLASGGNWLLRLAGLGAKDEKFAQEERVVIRN